MNAKKKTTALARGAVVTLLLAGCGDEGETEPGAASTGSSSSATTTSAGPTTSATTTSTTSATTGGEGGAGGQGGSGGAGTGGSGGAGTGGGDVCLEAADFDDLFSLVADDLCAIAIYDAPGVVTEQYGAIPTWGAHGGLLVGAFDVESGGIDAVTLHRLSAPAGVNGELALDVGAALDVGIAPSVFVGAQVTDLWSGLSAFNYSGTPFDTLGGLVIVDDLGLVDDRLLIGGFAMGAVTTMSDDRLLYSALQPLDAVGGVVAGLYVAERCDPGELCAPAAIATWGDSTGPLAVDASGNAFAIMTSFDGTQEARGWSAEQLEPGVDAGEGATVFSLGGFGSPLAALAPRGEAAGLLAFQPTDATTFLPTPPVVVAYVVEGGAIVARGKPERFLDPAVADAPLTLVNDDEQRIWVGVPLPAPALGSRFVVLARR